MGNKIGVIRQLQVWYSLFTKVCIRIRQLEYM